MPLPDHSSIVIVTPDEELEMIIGALRAHGATAADAPTQATMLVEGDLRGHSSHRIRRLPASGTDGRETAVPGDRARAVRTSRMTNGSALDHELWATAKRLNEQPA